MNWPPLTLAAAVLLSVAYVLLAMAALFHVDENKKAILRGRLPVFFFWWPFYSDIYTGSARKLCIYGRVLFPLIVAAYILWAVLKTSVP